MEQTTTYTIYFGSSQLLITSKPVNTNYVTVEVDESLLVSRAKVIKKVETNKFVAIISPNVELTFGLLSDQFKVVKAAGGVVTSSNNKLLMINLRNHWDLPKGHIEPGEESHTAALREVEEETGIKAEIIGNKPLATTYHAYNTYGPWELKETHWWAMHAEECTPSPQHDEGITAVEWCSREVVDSHMTNTYDTIKEVIAALDMAANNNEN